MALICVQVDSRPDRGVINKFVWFLHPGGMQKKYVL